MLRLNGKFCDFAVLSVLSFLLMTISGNASTGLPLENNTIAANFSSAYTDTTKDCKGQEPTFTCKGYGNYRVVIGVGGVFSGARVESTKSDYSLSIAEHQSVGWNPKIEWRMADGKPFAVILRVDINDENADIPKKTGESIIIKGLQGYETIDQSIDAKTPRANEKAREIADSGFAGGAADKASTALNGDSIDSAYTDGEMALLPNEKIENLKKINAAVAVPTYLPAGFKLKNVEIEKTEAHIILFSMDYAAAGGKSFRIQSNNEGLGDMAVKREVKGKNPYFLDTAQETTEFYTGHDENDAKTIASEWLCSLEKYQPKTSKLSQCFQLLSDSQSISPDEAMKILQSLRYLKR